MGNTLSDSKKDLIIAYVLRFSDTLGDNYFHDLGNDDLEHHLENLDDRKLINIYKEIKEELSMQESKKIQESKTIKKSDLNRLVEQLVKECGDLSEEEDVIVKDKKITKMVRADQLANQPKDKKFLNKVQFKEN